MDIVVIESQEETKVCLNDFDGIVIRQKDIVLGKECSIVITYANIDIFIMALQSLKAEVDENRVNHE